MMAGCGFTTGCSMIDVWGSDIHHPAQLGQDFVRLQQLPLINDGKIVNDSLVEIPYFALDSI
jgi:hypothetical protein